MSKEKEWLEMWTSGRKEGVLGSLSYQVYAGGPGDNLHGGGTGKEAHWQVKLINKCLTNNQGRTAMERSTNYSQWWRQDGVCQVSELQAEQSVAFKSWWRFQADWPFDSLLWMKQKCRLILWKWSDNAKEKVMLKQEEKSDNEAWCNKHTAPSPVLQTAMFRS